MNLGRRATGVCKWGSASVFSSGGGGGGCASSSGADPNGRPQGIQKSLAPLLLHFDVNKTVIQTDSIQSKSIEEGIREGVAELFWGYMTPAEKAGDRESWEWSRSKPSCNPPMDLSLGCDRRRPITYALYCKHIFDDKGARGDAVRTFKYVGSEDARVEMEKLVAVAMRGMQLPSDVKYTKAAEEAGLKGPTLLMFPAVFHFVAALQRSRRTFAVLFRSFGADHEQIKAEWNAFCENRHPMFSKLLQDIGPMDGTTPGVPDRRIHSLHTVYRDAQGPVLIQDTFTNGLNNSWDAWARQKPKPKFDTRGGREYIQRALHAPTSEGYAAVQKWMRHHLLEERTSAIKDDWAWWQWNGCEAHAAKILTVIGGQPTKQLFFDDNVDMYDPRIVDCRDVNGAPVPFDASINRLCVKVNPVEALLDKEYFMRKLQLCHGEHLDVGSSVVDAARQFTEVEDHKSHLEKQLKQMAQQLKNLTEENRRMKLRDRITVRDESHLREILARAEVDVEQFGTAQDGRPTISQLYSELERGHCWLEQGDAAEGPNGVVRVFEMVFIKVQFKDLVLIESHEQDDAGRVQSRNYLPGMRKTLREHSFDEALQRWVSEGLNVDLSKCITAETLPVYIPEALHQETKATQAYPIPCKIQQSEATYIVGEKTSDAVLLGKIGLPQGKHFTTTEKDVHNSTITRFWRWDKLATWEATSSSLAKGGVAVTHYDPKEVFDELFQDHPRREVYEKLLLQMFETFTAKKLCGGFSGSVVIRVQPFEPGGRPGEPCIVKLDRGDAIEEEYKNSHNVFKALPDRAARILGDAVYAHPRDKPKERYGAFRLELAGACWNVPELAQGSANLLSTFKDLLLYESEQSVLARSATAHAAAAHTRPFGNVMSVLAETFGSGGIVSSLRKGGKGVRRSDVPLPWGWYTLKGKSTAFNPFTAGGKYPPEIPMRRLYEFHFGVEMPPIQDLIGRIRPQLEQLAGKKIPGLMPLVGLAHGDLNAANIMIDALDAVWLIDFATSVELPLFTDMCKFEMACLFEYTTIPITPKMLLDFATTDKGNWEAMNVSDWIRVDQDVAEGLLRRLCQLDAQGRLAELPQNLLDELIEEVAAQSSKQHKRKVAENALRARLTANEKDVADAFCYCSEVSKALCQGDYIFETLSIKMPAHSTSHATGSVRFFVDLVASVRRFMSREVLACLKEIGGDLEPCDALSLQLWLPFLRETYRIVGYGDISPQHKVWAIYHCNEVAQRVLSILRTINRSLDNLKALEIMNRFTSDLTARHKHKGGNFDVAEKSVERSPFAEAQSHWFLARKDVFPGDSSVDRMVRKIHWQCKVFRDRPGVFSPIYQVLRSDTDEPMPLHFDEASSGHGAWTLHIVPPGDTDVPRASALGPVVGPELPAFCIGSVSVSARGEPQAVTLQSRLLFVTANLMRRKLRRSPLSAEPLEGGFELSAWAKGIMLLEAQCSGSHGGALRKRSGSVLAQLPDDFKTIMTLEAVAKDRKKKEVCRFHLGIGPCAPCYPAGSYLCVDHADGNQSAKLPSTEVVVGLLGNGCYQMRNSADPRPETERQFEPTLGNHVYVAPCAFKEGQRLIMESEEHNIWMDAEVVSVPKEETGYRYVLTIFSSPVSKHNSWASDVVAGEDDDAGDESRAKVFRHLSPKVSGMAWLPADAFYEEAQKIKVYFRARSSFIIDALSGRRLDVKSCAPPTLHITRSPVPVSQGAHDGEEEITARKAIQSIRSHFREAGPSLSRTNVDTPGGRRRHVRTVTLTPTAMVSESSSSAPTQQDTRPGWQVIAAAAERYEKGLPSCSPISFMVLGSPGSGKTALVCRLIMECLDRFTGLIPLTFQVADMVKRTADQETLQEATGVDETAVRGWFDKYLRLTYGEDSQRYKMVRQAIAVHRVMFIFEGLTDCGALAELVEGLIQDLVLDRHLVVVTSRPLLPGMSSLQDVLSEFMITMTLKNLTDEHKRAIATARLGADGLRAFDDFFLGLQQGNSMVGDSGRTGEEAGEGEDEDVFGNPMMLSMLICYLQPDRDKEKRAVKDSDSVTLTEVYRVAIDVMLQQVQSKQQADRFSKDGNVNKCKRVLEKLAMTMQVQRCTEFDVVEFERLLPANMKGGWQTMRDAVEAGHAMFLRVQKDGERVQLSFMAKVFQNFFAASEISTAKEETMCSRVSLYQLLTDSWWAQMLEMLAEASPNQYVKVIEGKLEKFEVEQGDTVLHVAAKVGHRPIFQLLRRFTTENQEAIFTKNTRGQTPMHVAAERGNLRICKLLIDHKACLETEDLEERKPMHVAMQSGHFALAKYVLDAYVKETRFHTTLGVRGNHAENIARRILEQGSQDNPFTEEDFKKAMETFVEIKYFTPKETIDKKRAIGALLAVYWICADQYESFVRAQDPKAKLTHSSWGNLQEWTRKSVGLTSSPATVGAMLVFVALMSLGKIKSFKQAFAPDCDEHNEALASILQKSPLLIPSFARLNDNLKHTILSALKANNFNFGQFLQAENLPANLSTVKDILGEGASSEKILGFFLFKTFAQMCGIHGAKSLEGSLFMTDKMYNNFKVGLDVLHHLIEESAQEVYNRFLEARARSQKLTFDKSNPESVATARLACLSRTYDEKSGGEVEEAFRALEPRERRELAGYLNADGINQKGFLLYNSPNLLETARQKDNIGLVRALRMLLKVYKMVDKEFQGNDSHVTATTNFVTIMVDELAEQAKKCEDPEVFDFSPFEIAVTSGGSVQGQVQLSPWQLVSNPGRLDQLANDAEDFNQLIIARAMREPAFLKKLPNIFPEMKYFTQRADDVTERLRKQTLGALLSIYWVASDQPEAFTRGQLQDTKLSERSWVTARQWRDDMAKDAELLTTLMVAVICKMVGKIHKLRQQLAPGALSHHEAIGDVMRRCPKVLPSYMRLDKPSREIVLQCLTCDFKFEHFLYAENLPANLTALKAMSNQYNGRAKERFMLVFLLAIFAFVSGSQGAESLEGAVFMTEERFQKFKMGIECLRQLEKGSSELDVYGQLLRQHALGRHLPCGSPETRAVVRMACLAQVTDAQEVTSAFEALDSWERQALVRYLNVDGITERPGFILCDSPAFLERARENSEVGLKAATRILLRVYEAANKEFHGSKEAVISVQLGELALFAREFFGSVAFQDMTFQLQRLPNDREALIIPKLWTPVNNQTKLRDIKEKARELAKQILESKIDEEKFKKRIRRVFPELRYFDEKSGKQSDQTWGAMLAVHWLVSNKHEEFIRGQPRDKELSLQSWAWIQEWMAKAVKLSNEEAVDAALVFQVIHALCKIKEFREELAPGYDATMHDVALARVLEDRPEVVPSFLRLDRKYQTLIKDSLSVDFQFSQFLGAESPPANLVVMKEKLKPHGDDGLAFFCFRIFAQMCGKQGSKRATGSAFMTEAEFQRFRPGLEVLQQLRRLDASAAYDAFLLQRGSKAMFRFASAEQRALARLLCLASAFDKDGGDSVCNAFDELTSEERVQLSWWLNQDGIHHMPGYTLVDATALLQSAKTNRAVGLPAALRALLQVQDLCQPSRESKQLSKVVVHLAALACWAKEAGPDQDEFLHASLAIHSEVQGETRLVTVEVDRPRTTTGAHVEGDSTSEEGESEVVEVQGPALPVVVTLATVSIVCVAAALILQLVPGSSVDAMGGNPALIRILQVVLVALSVLLLAGGVLVRCSGQRRHHSYAPLSQSEEQATTSELEGPREPFLKVDGWNLAPARRRHDYQPLPTSEMDIP